MQGRTRTRTATCDGEHVRRVVRRSLSRQFSSRDCAAPKPLINESNWQNLKTRYKQAKVQAHSDTIFGKHTQGGRAQNFICANGVVLADATTILLDAPAMSFKLSSL